MNSLKFSHILYKTDNLKEEIKRFEEKGFKVKPGSGKKPYNAFIYLEKDVFIELFTFNHPKILITIFKAILNFSNPSMCKRIEKYQTTNIGDWCDYCVEASDDSEYNGIINKIRINGLEIGKAKTFSKNNNNGSKTNWVLNAPIDNTLPFFMGQYTSLLSMSKDLLIHKNEITGISEIHVQCINIEQSVKNYDKIFDIAGLEKDKYYFYNFDNSKLVLSEGKKNIITNIIFDNDMI